MSFVFHGIILKQAKRPNTSQKCMNDLSSEHPDRTTYVVSKHMRNPHTFSLLSPCCLTSGCFFRTKKGIWSMRDITLFICTLLYTVKLQFTLGSMLHLWARATEQYDFEDWGLRTSKGVRVCLEISICSHRMKMSSPLYTAGKCIACKSKKKVDINH